MERCSRRGRVARGCLGCLLFWATAFGPGGVSGDGEVSMPDVVEVEVGKTAVIPCHFSLPENGTYAYIHWYSLDKTQRKRIISLLKSKEQNEDPKLKDRLSITPEYSLEIRKVGLPDAKAYICQVGLGSLGVAENRTRLQVSKAPEPPVIQKSDRGIMASDSEKYEIATCVSRNSYPASTITWFKDEEPLSENGNDIEIHPRHTVESSGLYTVHSTLLAQVTKDDRHALFHCQVDYTLMGRNETAVSRNFTINIHYPSEEISFGVNSPSPAVKEGDSVTLHCRADGNPPPEYTLVKLQDGEEQVLPEVSGGKVVLPNVTRDQSGTYVCRALDLQSFMELNTSVNLFVNYLDVPRVRSMAVNAEEHHRKHPQEGDTVVLSCNTTSSGPVEFQWEKKGKLFSKENPLRLTEVTYQDMGDYTCRVSMPTVPGLTRLKVASITVHSKPKMAMPEEVVYVQEGEVVNLTCSVFSVLKPKFSWSAKNITSHPPTSRNHQHHSTVSVQVTEALLASGINCSAENKLGTAEHQFVMQQRADATETGVKQPDEMLKPAQESRGVIIVAVIVCIMLVSILGAVLYFLHKKGKLRCGRSGKQEITRPDAQKDDIVVEVKSEKSEEAGLLQGANGEKKPASDQGEEYINLRN